MHNEEFAKKIIDLDERILDIDTKCGFNKASNEQLNEK